MALNLQTLKTRSITAVVFVIVMLSGLLVSGWLFLALFLFIMAGATYEFVKINRLIYPSGYVYQLIWIIPYIIIPIMMLTDLGFQGRFFSMGLRGLHASHYNPLYPCAVIFSIWLNDTMAYLVGSLIGKTPFSTISPKKTWEGTLGGILLSVVLIALLGHFLNIANHKPWTFWAHLALVCSIAGTLGDLLESKLKRMAGIKDSGQIMPGHGGFLDRFDSLLLAAPAAWFYVKWFG